MTKISSLCKVVDGIRAILVVSPFILRTLLPFVVNPAIARAIKFFRRPLAFFLCITLTESGRQLFFDWLDRKLLKKKYPWLENLHR